MHSTSCEELNNYIGDLENLYTPHVRCEVLDNKINIENVSHLYIVRCWVIT